MKIKLKNIAILFISVLTIGFVSSCSDDDEDTDSLVGTTWYYVGDIYAVNTGNTVYDQIIKEEEDMDGDEGIFLVFKENGICALHMDREVGYPKDISYEQHGNKVTINGIAATIDGYFLYTQEEDVTERIQGYIENGNYSGVSMDTQVISASRIPCYKKKVNQ